MTENKLNNMDVKRNNRSRVYHLLYEHGPESLKNIAGILDMSMPTLLQNVKELKAENLDSWNSGVKESYRRAEAKGHLAVILLRRSRLVWTLQGITQYSC